MSCIIKNLHNTDCEFYFVAMYSFLINFRSSYQRCFIIKGVLRNFAKFTGKHLCQSLFLSKVTRRQACNFIKKETMVQMFCYEFCKISKNAFFTEHLWTAASVTLHSFPFALITHKIYWPQCIRYALETLQKTTRYSVGMI